MGHVHACIVSNMFFPAMCFLIKVGEHKNKYIHDIFTSTYMYVLAVQV